VPVSRKRKTKTPKKPSRDRDPRAGLIRDIAHYPVRDCFISKEWRDRKAASILFSRSHPDGRVAFAAFFVDIGCLGVKSAFANPAITEAEYSHAVNRLQAGEEHVGCAPALALKLIRGGYQYAAKLGFKPDPDYFYSREIFGAIDPDSCSEMIEYGDNGKPLYVAGPNDNAKKVMAHLTRTLGPDGFKFIAPLALPDH